MSKYRKERIKGNVSSSQYDKFYSESLSFAKASYRKERAFLKNKDRVRYKGKLPEPKAVAGKEIVSDRITHRAYNGHIQRSMRLVGRRSEGLMGATTDLVGTFTRSLGIFILAAIFINYWIFYVCGSINPDGFGLWYPDGSIELYDAELGTMVNHRLYTFDFNRWLGDFARGIEGQFDFRDFGSTIIDYGNSWASSVSGFSLADPSSNPLTFILSLVKVLVNLSLLPLDLVILVMNFITSLLGILVLNPLKLIFAFVGFPINDTNPFDAVVSASGRNGMSAFLQGFVNLVAWLSEFQVPMPVLP